MASGWKPKTSSSSAYSSSVGLTMSSQKVASLSRRAAARASNEVSWLTRSSAYLMKALSILLMYHTARGPPLLRGRSFIQVREMNPPATPPAIELPHTAGCLVCGRQNPHGLRLSLHVDPGSGVVTVE